MAVKPREALSGRSGSKRPPREHSWEYVTDATMTSRFGKTYSRKGGDGNSKFDEVLSNKRATLSTKWGETTFKAQLGPKRPPPPAPEASEAPKRPRRSAAAEQEEPVEQGHEDPFGFDSDEEDSRPVTSRSVPQQARPAAAKLPPHPEPLRAERREHNSHAVAVATETTAPAGRTSSVLDADWSAQRVSEDFGSAYGSGRAPAAKTPQSWLNEGAQKHSYSWYKNASESDKKPISPTTSLKTEAKEPLDSWTSVMGLRSASPDAETFPGRDAPCWTAGYGQGDEKLDEPAPELDRDFSSSAELGHRDLGLPVEPSESDSQSLPRPSNCRTYRRPNKCKEAKPVGRGRARDYTVLHPSCLSVCNVTIQDSMERGIDDFPTTTSADPGEVSGWLRKKTEATPAKPARFRPAQSKTKKESKLEFFGFEENEGQEVEGDLVASGSANYKIKYFGFDDLSESDSEEDEEEGSQAAEKRRAKKAAAAAVAMAMSVDSPPPSDSQDSQASTITDILDFPDESYPAAFEVPKRQQGKLWDRTKESSRKIFSGPKKFLWHTVDEMFSAVSALCSPGRRVQMVTPDTCGPAQLLPAQFVILPCEAHHWSALIPAARRPSEALEKDLRFATPRRATPPMPLEAPTPRPCQASPSDATQEPAPPLRLLVLFSPRRSYAPPGELSLSAANAPRALFVRTPEV
ncbi:hypothetical protein AAFF_G00085580 [Aldrovandia affinis]|uniref:Uncharacterized protein n=1 Tax=Aldrovandia affinis TaxID=143900 RepID=A0AAD7RWP4_9TELE|nr:hypothetical protein AAFF_G00085580 [Aldrovandia affinis]